MGRANRLLRRGAAEPKTTSLSLSRCRISCVPFIGPSTSRSRRRIAGPRRPKPTLNKGGTRMAGKDQVPKDFRRVVVAAAVGNIIEWYDFYIFGSLAAIL